jgi:hypothetical protein
VEYVTPGNGVINQIADSAEELTISTARNDAAYALTMVERPEVCRAELRLLVRKLASTIKDVATVAELRGERLNSPVAKALEDVLRATLRGERRDSE